MSTRYISTLDPEALASMEDFEQRELVIESILKENRRLSTENAALRHCLILTKEHAELVSANIVATSLSWCDDKLRKFLTDVLSTRSQRVIPGYKTEGQSGFRPISPASKTQEDSRVLNQSDILGSYIRPQRSSSPPSRDRFNPASTAGKGSYRPSSPPLSDLYPLLESTTTSPRPQTGYKLGSKPTVSPRQATGTRVSQFQREEYRYKHSSSVPIPDQASRQAQDVSRSPRARPSPSRKPLSTASPAARNPSLQSRPTDYRSPRSSSRDRDGKYDWRTESRGRQKERSSIPSSRTSPSYTVSTPRQRSQSPHQRNILNSSPRATGTGNIETSRNDVSPQRLSFGSPTSSKHPLTDRQPFIASAVHKGAPPPKPTFTPSVTIRDTSPKRPAFSAPVSRPVRTPPPVKRSVTPTKSPRDVPRTSRASTPVNLGHKPIIKSPRPSREPRPTTPTEIYTNYNASRYSELSPTGNAATAKWTLEQNEYIASGANTTSEGYQSQLGSHDSAYFNPVGKPVAMSTPMKDTHYHRPDFNYGPSPTRACSQDTLAEIMGITGEGAKQRAQSVVYRAVDTLTGYQPNVSKEMKIYLKTARPSRRMVGEIAFQLDRRILEYVFVGDTRRVNTKDVKRNKPRYYGFSLTNILQMIQKESKVNGVPVPSKELEFRRRLDRILRSLRPFSYVLEYHSEFTQDIVNKFGLLNGPPDQKTVEGFGLDDPVVLRVLLNQVIRDEKECRNMMIILDCLCYLAHLDKRSLFMW